ncbi:ThuA domain-containing protein [Paenibacillus spongiae]|uniref:ThuA domain-containing protein n=1 Tax=Paenibacillus spongiae TaxID=2909671 RepID=A0ABY5SA85_9BACL|nr:ThuA domain-containing protein [Paenibacillus spongiae]UVI29628.1 ThuA domain-containing protein [Paenibacillus spongiae]
MESNKVKKVVLIAGEPSHGPGAHEYDKTVRLLKVLLDQSIYSDRLQVHAVSGGWPDNDELLEDADLLLFVTDGRDGELYRDVPFVANEQRIALMKKLMDGGCGLILLHFSTFFTREEGKSVLAWAGGYFEWEDERGERNWYSRIDMGSRLDLSSREHPICTGVADTISLQDEVYFHLRMIPDDPRRIPIWTVPELAGDHPEANLVGWALERENGGRSFVTTAGHSYSIWEDEGFRRLNLQALLWAAGFAIPVGGIHSRFYADEVVDRAFAAMGGDGRAVVTGQTVRALVLAGNDEHKWHNWEETTPLIMEALHENPAITAALTLDADALGQWDLTAFDTIVLNYCNWKDPAGLSEQAKSALIGHMERGGGLVALHFSNGAFHFSLPEAGGSDWPEYRKMVPHVWNHHGDSGHDNYGSFRVKIADREHPIMRGLPDFDVRDELYYRQEASGPAAGEERSGSVHVLYGADSVNTGQHEPLAWTARYRNGRVLQTLLGHDRAAYEVLEVREMLRRSVLWTANKL